MPPSIKVKRMRELIRELQSKVLKYEVFTNSLEASFHKCVDDEVEKRVERFIDQYNQDRASEEKSENQSLHVYLQEVLNESEGLKNRNGRLSVDLAEARGHNTRLVAENTRLREENTWLREYYQELLRNTQKLHHMESRCTALHMENGNLVEEKNKALTGVKDKEEEIARRKSKIGGLRNKVAQLNNKITGLEDDLKDAEYCASGLEKDKRRLENTVHYLKGLLSRKGCRFF
ncbi:hypothetical protein BO78DRAFT_436829 [Aspergillus sclerotiicarbonarius CBS 121057]|uniref:Uncharacterized protein n=1 Tax=Aspergillus sclerotiicarbonarius (strain CBS 121057 / IBT 28362) TaxID=1448318 RepID=A0A319EKK3_ASPSB|nr:hypothetical protein BO78DRAFT_436829 [Aspergillus sclerotiicarbonarius CBS 121057]